MVPPDGVRPTQDRVRQSLYSSLGADFTGWRVLDLFAGSGALGLEAWSRGAEYVCWVENDSRVFPVLSENVARLCAGRPGSAVCRRLDALRLDALAACEKPFDLALADPPYDASRAGLWLQKILSSLAGHDIVRPGGWLVFEMGADRSVPPEAPGWTLSRDRVMGQSRVLRYLRG